jgi:rod shape determining protein RodA
MSPTMAQPRPRPRSFDEPRVEPEARPRLAHLDPLLVIAAVGLIGFSVFTLAMTTRGDVPGDPYYYAVRQAIYGVVGIALMLGLARIDYSRFRELRVGLYTFIIASIGLVFILGNATRGSKRWIELPFFTFQPSELAKLLLMLALAGFVIDRVRRPSERQRTARLLLLGLIPAALVLMQPDLGTALVLGVIALSILFVAGIKWTHFALLGAIAAGAIAFVLVLAPAIGIPVLQGYQQDRLTSFLNPSDDPGDSSYQSNQALIAVGAGGKTGRGDESTQTRNDFLPEHHTDFMFAAVGERFGFVGAAFLLSLYALLIWRALRIMTLSKNLYGSMIAGAIAAMLMFQVFVNVGMNLAIMPVTGITLPLMSFGGSSALVTFMAIGVLQSIYVQAQLTSKSGAGRLRRPAANAL